PFAEARRSVPDIDCHIEDRAADDPYELILREGRRLIMQPAQHSDIRGIRVIVLNPFLPNSVRRESRLRVGFREEPATVAMAIRYDLQNFRDGKRSQFHDEPILEISATRRRR